MVITDPESSEQQARDYIDGTSTEAKEINLKELKVETFAKLM